MNVGVNIHFRVHVRGIREIVSCTVRKLRCVLKTNCGMKRREVNVVIKGLVMVAIMYCMSAWYEVIK